MPYEVAYVYYGRLHAEILETATRTRRYQKQAVKSAQAKDLARKDKRSSVFPPVNSQAVLLYSHRCDLSCRHCCTRSGPRETAAMSFPTAARALELFHLAGFRDVTLSGGEPMLFKDAMVRLLGVCRAVGLKASMITNANWAVTARECAAEVADLRAAGLDSISVSVDRYHLAQLPVERIWILLEACRKQDMPCGVSLGELTAGDVAEQQLPADFKAAGYPCSQIQECMPLGRALDAVRVERLPPVGHQACPVACNVTADVDGSVYGCCAGPGLPDADRAVISVGNLKRETPATVLARLPKTISMLIWAFGPVWLLKMACDYSGVPVPSKRPRFICEACRRLFEEPWRSLVSEYAASQTARARLLCRVALATTVQE